jgi:AcrR family transcriptional regulator
MTSSPAPSPPLTSEAIVETALALAEADGLAALSMRRLATALDAAPMSLYRHVANKDELLALMAEYGLSSLPAPDPDGAWEDELTRFFTDFYDLLRERPVVAQVMVIRPVTSPQLTLRGEQILALLAAAGVDDADAVAALLTLTWFVLGAAQYATARAPGESTADRFAGLPPGAFPTLARVGEHFAEDRRRDQFLTGLSHLVDGYAKDA